MPQLEDIITDLSQVDPAFHKLYVKGSDGYTFNVEHLEQAPGLKSALQKERESVRQMRERLDHVMSAIGDDVDEDALEALREGGGIAGLSAALDAAKNSDHAKALQKEKERLTEQYKRQYEKALNTEKQRVEGLQRYIMEEIVDAEAAKAIAEHRGIYKLLRPHVKERVKVIEENGRYRAVVVDEHGEPRLKNINGDAMSISDLIAEYKNDTVFQNCFEGINATGMGASGARGRAAGGAVHSGNQQLSPTEKIRAGLEARQR